MADNRTYFRPEVIELAWDAAWASNEAFEELKVTYDNIVNVDSLEAADVEISSEGIIALSTRLRNNVVNFELLRDMADLVMKADNSPFTVSPK